MTKMYFSDILGLYPLFLKMLQRQKGEMGVLLLMKVTFGSHPPMVSLVTRRTNPVIRGLGLSVLPPTTSGGQSWKLNRLIANDSVHRASAMKPL